jgi:ABC-type phosphate transport system substrate-binding protein
MRSLKLAIGGVLASAAALFGGAAHALPPSDYDASVLNVYYGGATATDNILENNFLTTTGGICAPNTIDIYRVQVANRNNRVIFCNVTSAQVPGFPAGGTKVAFHKESIGGSSNGVVPIALQQNLQFFNMAVAASCTDNGLKNTGSTALREYREWIACPDNTVQQIPSGGISDTEPNLSFPVLSAGQIATLTSTPGLGIMFGVPVTLKLYRALQAAQGLTQDDTQANVPSLTSTQIRGLYTQRISQWSQLRSAANAPITGTAGSPPFPVNAFTGANDDKVYICRRVNSSGTQASFESYWLQQRCDAKNGATTALVFAGGQGASMDVGTTPLAQGFNSRVTPNEGSGDVRSCLNAHDTNGTWAIGTLSTEVTAAQLGGFRMVKVDGAYPNLANVANGDYDFFTENTLNRRAVGQPGAPSGLTLTLQQYLETNIGRPAVISLANTPFQGRPWGDGGVLTLATAAGVTPNLPAQVDGAAGAGTMRANPVNTQSRSLIGSKVNNCNPPVMMRPSPTP